MIRRERDRLRKLFRELCLASLAAPLGVAACDETPKTDTSLDASAIDASVEDGSVDAGADAAPASWSPGCEPINVDSADAAYYPDAPFDFCMNLVRLPCGLPEEMVPRSQCYLPLSDCDKICPGAFFNCHAMPEACIDGSVPRGVPINIDCVTCLGSPGRRPRGLESALQGPRPSRLRRSSATCARSSPRSAGEVLAEMAHLEAAAVHAFRILAADLREAGAPRELVRAARDAARDEIRHARVVARLARRFGSEKPRPARVRKTERPSLEALARENAVEGCVHETYAALLATWQAEHAHDREVASVMSRIASDETRHAALSWAIARWVEPLLEASARARVEAARDEAARTLIAQVGIEAHDGGALGLPSPAEQRRLARALMSSLPGVMETAA